MSDLQTTLAALRKRYEVPETEAWVKIGEWLAFKEPYTNPVMSRAMFAELAALLLATGPVPCAECAAVGKDGWCLTLKTWVGAALLKAHPGFGCTLGRRHSDG